MKPLSITNAVLALLAACVKVSISIRQLRNGAGEAKSKVSSLLSDVSTERTGVYGSDA